MNAGPTVVIVEDDPTHATLIAQILATVAPNARVEMPPPEAAPAFVAEAPFGALVLVDRRLEGGDSLALLRAVAVARPDLRLVLMSSFVTLEDRDEALHAGARSVFEKPGDLNGWRSMLLGLLAPPISGLRAA